MKNKTADRILVCLEVDGEIHQVALDKEKQEIMKRFLHAMFDGPINVLEQTLPLEFRDKLEEKL